MKRTLALMSSLLTVTAGAGAIAATASAHHGYDGGNQQGGSYSAPRGYDDGPAGYGNGEGYGSGNSASQQQHKIFVSGVITAVNGSSFTATISRGHHGFGHGFHFGFSHGFGGGYGYGAGYDGRFNSDWARPPYGYTNPAGYGPATTTGTGTGTTPTPTDTMTGTVPTPTTPTGTTPTPPAPAPSSITVTTDSSTTFDVNGNRQATAADLAVGDKFVAEYKGTYGESLTQLTSQPAIAVYAFAPPQPKSLYAFVGTVSATNTSANPETVTVTVSASRPNGEFTGSQTFTVGPRTLVFGGSSDTPWGGSLSQVAVGDTVSGALWAPKGESASAVEANPLKVLVDFPAAPATTPTTTTPTTGTATTPPTTTGTTPTGTATTGAPVASPQVAQLALKRAESLAKKSTAKKATKKSKKAAKKPAKKAAKRK